MTWNPRKFNLVGRRKKRRPYRHLSKDQHVQLVSLYLSGRTRAWLEEFFNIGQATLARHLKPHLRGDSRPARGFRRPLEGPGSLDDPLTRLPERRPGSGPALDAPLTTPSKEDQP
jgi:hypothetical protein